MSRPEATLLIINLTLLVLAYGYVYPRLAGNRLDRLLWLDALTTATALGAAALGYAGTGTRFRLAGFEMNWFWFALVTFLLIELPLAYSYLARRGRWGSGGD